MQAGGEHKCCWAPLLGSTYWLPQAEAALQGDEAERQVGMGCPWQNRAGFVPFMPKMPEALASSIPLIRTVECPNPPLPASAFPSEGRIINSTKNNYLAIN